MNPYQLQKRLTEIETQIHDLEAQLDDLTNAIQMASAAGNAYDVRVLGEQYTQTETDLHAAMEAWAALAE